jgi:hypothetical protein
MRSLITGLVLAAATFSQLTHACVGIDQPNPIAPNFPPDVTGTLNGTLAVLPVPLRKIQTVIPPQWNILEKAYRQLLPRFPKGHYPLILQGLHDHDIQVYAADFHVDDFSVSSNTYLIGSLGNEAAADPSINRERASSFPSWTFWETATRASPGPLPR